MRISDILIISWTLLLLSGTYDGVWLSRKGERFLYAFLLLGVLALRNTVWKNAWISVHASSALLTGILFSRMRRGEWGGILIVILFGGLLGWKLASSYPLFSEQGLLLSVVFISLACIYCRTSQVRLAGVAGAAILSGLFQYVQDALLFGYGRVIVGSAELLDAQTIGAYVLLNLQVMISARKKRSIINPVHISEAT